MDKKKLRRVLPAIGVATGIVVLSTGVVAPSATARARDDSGSRYDLQREPRGSREPQGCDTKRSVQFTSRRC